MRIVSQIYKPVTVEELALIEHGIKKLVLCRSYPRHGKPFRVILGEVRYRTEAIAEYICDDAYYKQIKDLTPDEIRDSLASRYELELNPERWVSVWKISNFKRYDHPIPCEKFGVQFPGIPWKYAFKYPSELEE